MRLIAAILLFMLSIFVIPPVFAAEASLDTIVVTATRTDENVEKTPVLRYRHNRGRHL